MIAVSTSRPIASAPSRSLSSIRVTSDRYGHLFPQARADMADALDETYRTASGHSADFSRTSGGLSLLPSASQGP
jgi:hypothetical protein